MRLKKIKLITALVAAGAGLAWYLDKRMRSEVLSLQSTGDDSEDLDNVKSVANRRREKVWVLVDSQGSPVRDRRGDIVVFANDIAISELDKYRESMEKFYKEELKRKKSDFQLESFEPETIEDL